MAIRRLWLAHLALLLATSSAASSQERPLDLAGVRRDTMYFIGYQFVAVAAIGLAPKDDTNYGELKGFDKWLDNVTHPVWDQDRDVVNYVLHPYWGAAYYVRGRERGLDRQQSFWYSALLSSIFEFGAEAMVENVSIQDLLVTPIAGSLLGEYVFWPLREGILAKDGPLDTSDKVVLVLTDPLGAINDAVDHVFGVKSELTVAPMRFGSSMPHLRSRPAAVGWGVRWRVEW